MPHQTTFQVCDAQTPSELLPRLPYRYLLESRFLNGDLMAFSRNVPYLVDTRGENATLDRIETNPAKYGDFFLLGSLLSGFSVHPLIESIYTAFKAHYPLTLSPDHLWLVLCQGFATHVKENAEALRDLFVSHADKATLQIRRDDFVLGSPYNDWEGVFAEFNALIQTHIGATAELLTSRFSTTTATEQAAFNITLMDAMQPYFDYEVHTLCGIPTITLEGTPADWERLREQFNEFTRFDLGWWVEALMPTLDEFVNAAQGQINKTFWQNICKIDNKSGGPYFNGWMLRLFPYIKAYTSEGKEMLARNPYLLPEDQHPRQWGDGLSAGDFPASNAMTPLVWQYLDQRLDLLVLAGFVGCSQDVLTKSIRPEIGWALGEKSKMMTVAPASEAEWMALLQSKLAKRNQYRSTTGQ